MNDKEREEAELRQAIIDSLQTETRRQFESQPYQPDVTNGPPADGTTTDDIPHINKSASIQALTENAQLRLANNFDPVNDPLGDTLIYIGAPPPSKHVTIPENALMMKHFDKFFILQSSALHALQSSTFERLLRPNACIRAEKRLKKLGVYKDLFATVKSRIKYHIDLRPPNEDDEAVLLITNLTCSHGILNWHRAETFFSLHSCAIAGTDHFDGRSNPYYIQLLDQKEKATELVNRSSGAEYCPVRHHSGLERLLNAIAGNDPKLDSAPKVWVFFALAKYLGCSQHDSVRKWIFAWLWQPNNHNFVQSNPEAAYRIGLGCQSQELARDAFSILVGEKALVDVSHQLYGTVSSSLSSVHGRPFEILDDDELNRIGHAATSLVRRMRSVLHELVCKTDWMNESSEFRRVMKLVTKDSSQHQILLSAYDSLVEYVKYRLTTVLVCDLRCARDIFHARADQAAPHKKYRLKLVDTYNQLPYLARPFTRSFWQVLSSIKLGGSGDESDSLVWRSIWHEQNTLRAQDAVLGLGLNFLDTRGLEDVKRKFSMVNDMITAQSWTQQPASLPDTQRSAAQPWTEQSAPRPDTQHFAPPLVKLAPQAPRRRYTMKRMSNEWIFEEDRVTGTAGALDLVIGEQQVALPSAQPDENSMPTSPGKRRKISGDYETLSPVRYPIKTVSFEDKTGQEQTEGFTTSLEPTAGLSSFSSTFSRILTSTKNDPRPSSQAAAPTVGSTSNATNLSSNSSTAGRHAPVKSSQTSTNIQPWATQALPIRQQPSSVPPSWQTATQDRSGAMDGDSETDTPTFLKSTSTTSAADTDLAAEDPSGSTVAQGPSDSWWNSPSLSTPKRRPVQQFSNTNTGSSVQFSRPEASVGANFKSGKYDLDLILSELENIVHRRAMDITYPAHIFHDSSSLPVNLVDHVIALDDDEWKYLPLEVGGLDDGSGGVFDDAIPNIEIGGFRGGKRGIGSISDPSGDSESGTSSFEDVSSEAASTVGKASKIATDGTETVKSYDESESDTGFDYTDLYNEVQQLKVEQASLADSGTEGRGDAALGGGPADDSTIMGAASDVQGDFFGADDGDDDVDEQADTGEAYESDEDSDIVFVDVAV